MYFKAPPTECFSIYEVTFKGHEIYIAKKFGHKGHIKDN